MVAKKTTKSTKTIKSTKTTKKEIKNVSQEFQSSQSPVSIAKNQPELNIGLVGHVDHGKTTLTQALSGKWTDTHSEEIKRGITIRLGYADSVFYHNQKTDAYGVKPEPGFEPLRKVSFIDAPGHESLMATMLAGSMIMDGALLLVSAEEKCPQPQTQEHLSALQMCGIRNVVIIQNKIDLVSKERAKENYDEIRAFLKETEYAQAPVVPISARFNINMSNLIQTIQESIPTPRRNESESPLLLIARSFDINKPGSSPSQMKGGIIGGSLVKGKLSVGDMIEIRPGRVFEKKNQQVTQPYKTKITGIMSATQSVDTIIPGGSVALMTELDPSIVKSDKLVGNVVGLVDTLPPVWNELKLSVQLLKRVVGSGEELDVEPLRHQEPLMLNVNSCTTVGVVTHLAKKEAKCILKLPVCASVGDRVTISRRFGNRFRLIGYGIIQ